MEVTEWLRTWSQPDLDSDMGFATCQLYDPELATITALRSGVLTFTIMEVTQYLTSQGHGAEQVTHAMKVERCYHSDKLRPERVPKHDNSARWLPKNEIHGLKICEMSHPTSPFGDFQSILEG